MPPWFLEYLDGCAERLMKSPLEKPEQVAEAFDMRATGRNRTECERLNAVEMALRAEGDRKPEAGSTDIFEGVAKTRGVRMDRTCDNAY